MNEIKLEPCPFCDSTALIEDHEDWRHESTGWIHCPNCEADGPVVVYKTDYQPVRDAWNNGVKK